MVVLAWGCVPGFDEFRLGPRPDGGGGADGGGRDSGGGACAPVLECFESCAGVLGSVLLDETFDPGSEFSVRDGIVNIGGGTAELPAPQDFALLQSRSAFRNVAACATVRLGRSAGTEVNELHFGLRGLMHGVSLNLVGNEGEATLVSVEPERNVLVDRQDLQWHAGDGTFLVLVFLEGDRIYGEVRNQATGHVVTMGGVYGGTQDDVTVNFEVFELTTTANVDEVVAGPPSSSVAAVLRGD